MILSIEIDIYLKQNVYVQKLFIFKHFFQIQTNFEIVLADKRVCMLKFWLITSYYWTKNHEMSGFLKIAKFQTKFNILCARENPWVSQWAIRNSDFDKYLSMFTTSYQNDLCRDIDRVTWTDHWLPQTTKICCYKKLTNFEINPKSIELNPIEPILD